MNRLDGKVALLSGAARGIGGQTARRMAEAGAKVVIGDVLSGPGCRQLIRDAPGPMPLSDALPLRPLAWRRVLPERLM